MVFGLVPPCPYNTNNENRNNKNKTKVYILRNIMVKKMNGNPLTRKNKHKHFVSSFMMETGFFMITTFVMKECVHFRGRKSFV